jgi:hypothetical protein
MKIKVSHERNYGIDMFYPQDEWTLSLMKIFRPPSVKVKSLSKRQMEGLKDLGFEIEITPFKLG